MMLKPNRRFTLVASAAAAVLLSACASVDQDVKNLRRDIDARQPALKQPLTSPVQIAPVSRVTEISGKLIPVTAVNSKSSEWLKKISIELRIDNPTPLSAVVEKLAAQGLNVVSDLPLNSYTYVGRVNRTDAEAALKAVLGSVGLDYKADDARHLVMLSPMSSKTWYLNIGNRKSSYSSDGSLQASSSSGTTGNSSSSGGSTTGGSASSGSGTGSSPSNSGGSTGTTGGSTNSGSGTSSSGTSSTTNSTQSGSTAVASADDFWSSLSNELGNRLTVLLPRGGTAQQSTGIQNGLPIPGAGGMPGMMPGVSNMPGMPVIQQASQSQGSDANALYVKRQIGTFALNPETGAITVQAPHWILDDLDVYILRAQEMYNTDITFSGELVLVTNTRSDSEGFDLSAFASWASGKYAAVISNNALGGLTVSLPGSGGASVTAGAQTVGGPLIGLAYNGPRNALQIFNDFLSEIGRVSVIQRPLISTTSGVPGVFSKKYTTYYNTVSQQAASGGTGSAAVGTTNTLIPVDLGTELRINPRIDTATGLIRAQITLNQSIQSDTKNIAQTITFGNQTTTVNTPIPIVTRQNLTGEVLLRDGDLIVLGGQGEESLSTSENGLPGDDGPRGGVLGVKSAIRSAQTYYFALRVAVNKRK